MTKPADEVLAELAASGLPDSEIASRFGVVTRTVGRWRKAAGIPSSWVPDRFPCGTYASYARGCRCAPCTAANTAYCYEDRTRRVQRTTGADPEWHYKVSLFALIDFAAANQGAYSGHVGLRIRAVFGITPPRYFQLLSRAIVRRDALEYDPVTVNRLRRQAEDRKTLTHRRHGIGKD